MLYGLASDAHAVRLEVQTGLHGFKNILALPTRHSALLAGSAFLLYSALLAVRTPIAMHLQAILDGCVAPNQMLSGRAAVFVLLRIVNEICTVESTIELGTGGRCLRYDRGDSSFMAGKDLLALEVTPIRNRSELVGSHRSASLLRHE